MTNIIGKVTELCQAGESQIMGIFSTFSCKIKKEA